MKKKLFPASFCIIFLTLWSCHSVAPKTDELKADEPNNIRTYLSGVATEITDNALSEITSLPVWEEQRLQRYDEFMEMMGLQEMPVHGKRPDLNIKYTGTIQNEGFRIEKLYYESLPGLYVAANLYIPDDIKEPRPAILYVCGHSPTQKVRYQPYPRKFAELGFVCLIIETIQFGEVRGRASWMLCQGLVPMVQQGL